VLYRVAQAALTNVAQHAQADRVAVNFQKLRSGIRMEIHDNGKSFEVERVLFAKRNKRLGLLGMRERVEMVGGTFCVESTPGNGTTIRVEIPLDNGRERKEPMTKSVKSPGMSMKRITVLLAEDHEIVREASSVIEHGDDIEVIGEAQTGRHSEIDRQTSSRRGGDGYRDAAVERFGSHRQILEARPAARC
jgi:hypothetical protein